MPDPATVGLAVSGPNLPAGVRSVGEVAEMMIDAISCGDLEGFIDDVDHHFTDGLYARELRCPAGVLTATMEYGEDHFTSLLQGDITVYDQDTGNVTRRSAPDMWVTRAGNRRLVYHHEDSTVITYHPNPTNTRNVDEIEDRVVGREQMDKKRETIKKLEAARKELAA